MKQAVNDVVLGLGLLGAGLLLWLIAGPVYGMSGTPPEDMACEPDAIIMPGYKVDRCWTQEPAEPPKGYPPNPIAIVTLGDFDPPQKTWPLVMTLAKRSTEPVGNIKDASPWDKRYDVSDPYIFTPGDSLVIDDRAGNVSYIHDCRGKTCAAMDAKVSPDGTRIIYQVMWGDNWESIQVPGATLPNRQMHADYTDLWLYVVESGKSRRLTDNRAAGVSDMHPHWRSDSSIVLVSNRAKKWAPWAPAGSVHPINPSRSYNHYSLQLHMAEFEAGKLGEPVNWRPQAFMDMNPWVLTSGWTCLTAWHGPAPRQYGTPANATWIECADYNGADTIVELGAHTGGRGVNYEIHALIDGLARVSVEKQDELRAIRPVVEVEKGVLATTNYYRANFPYCGIIYRWRFTPETEGACLLENIPAATQYANADLRCSGRYAPGDIAPLTPYGHAQDSMDVRRTKAGNLPAGRACEVAPHPDGGYLLTHMRGGAPIFWPAEKYTDAFMMGEPLSKLEVRRVLPGDDGRIQPVNNPFDLGQSFCVAGCDLDVHAYKPQVIAPYQAIYGQLAPQALAPLESDDTRLRVVNLRAAQLDPIPGMTDEKSRVTFQGNAHPAYPAIVTDFCIRYVELWDTKPTRTGHQALQEEVCVKPLADGSLDMEIDPERPYDHYGKGVIDDQGTVGIVAQANFIDSNRKGEKRTCHGCHDGHSEEGAYDQTAVERFAQTMAGKAQ